MQEFIRLVIICCWWFVLGVTLYCRNSFVSLLLLLCCSRFIHNGFWCVSMLDVFQYYTFSFKYSDCVRCSYSLLFPSCVCLVDCNWSFSALKSVFFISRTFSSSSRFVSFCSNCSNFLYFTCTSSSVLTCDDDMNLNLHFTLTSPDLYLTFCPLSLEIYVYYTTDIHWLSILHSVSDSAFF